MGRAFVGVTWRDYLPDYPMVGLYIWTGHVTNDCTDIAICSLECHQGIKGRRIQSVIDTATSTSLRNILLLFSHSSERAPPEFWICVTLLGSIGHAVLHVFCSLFQFFVHRPSNLLGELHWLIVSYSLPAYLNLPPVLDTALGDLVQVRCHSNWVQKFELLDHFLSFNWQFFSSQTWKSWRPPSHCIWLSHGTDDVASMRALFELLRELIKHIIVFCVAFDTIVLFMQILVAQKVD